MKRYPVVVSFAAGLVLVASLASAAGAAPQSAPSRGASWLVSQQAPNGAVPASGRPDEVAEAVIALVAGAAPEGAIDKAIGFVAERGGADATRAAYVGRIILGALAARREPRALGGVDYVARLEEAYNATSGTYDSGLYANGLAYLAKIAVSGSLTERSRAYVTANQCADGGFANDPGCTRLADTDTTALLLSVLVRDDSNPAARDRARTWLTTVQNDDGGFPNTRGGPTNANSTALALSAIATLRESPVGEPWKRSSGNPLGALLRLQMSNGAFRFLATGGENTYATVQAVPAVAEFVPPTREEASPPGAPPSPSPTAPRGAAPGLGSLGDAGAAVPTTATIAPAVDADARNNDPLSARPRAASAPREDSRSGGRAYMLAAILMFIAAGGVLFALHRRRLIP